MIVMMLRKFVCVCSPRIPKLFHFSISCCAFAVNLTLKGFEIKLKPCDEFFCVRGGLTFNSENFPTMQPRAMPLNGLLYP